MHTRDSEPRRTTLRAVVGAFVLVGALVPCAGIVALDNLGRDFRSQRIHVRFAPGITEADRRAVERQLGLLEGAALGDRSWSYLLQDQSRDRLSALVSHPAVEDTDHVDRSTFRVQWERPDIPALLRALVAEGALPWLQTTLAVAAVLLGACGIRLLWKERATLAWVRNTVVVGVAHLVRKARKATARIWRAAGLRVTRVVALNNSYDSAIPLVIVGVATALVLPLHVGSIPEDNFFVHLYETPSILVGDHPYRDFFEWGAPLSALLSAVVQALVGYRVIGELALQWSFTIAGIVVAFQLGRRHAHRPGSVWLMVPAMLLMAARAGYHFSKLFCFPVGILLAWRYMERPTLRRSAAMGFFSGIAFLFRHDYAAWVGLASLLALLLAPIAQPPLRSVRRVTIQILGYAVAGCLTLLPWALLVATSEGLAPYVRARNELRVRERWGDVHPYGNLFSMNPFRQLRVPSMPPSAPGVISFQWRTDVDDVTRTAVESRWHLQRSVESTHGRESYRVPNIHDVRLLGLDDYVEHSEGIDHDTMNAVAKGVPVRTEVGRWLEQLTLLLPLVLIASAGLELVAGGRRGAGVTVGPLQRLLTGMVLVGINETLLREWSYFQVVGPLTAALSARFLIRAHRPVPSTAHPLPGRLTWALRSGGAAVAMALAASATYAVAVFWGPLQGESIGATWRQVRSDMRVWTTRNDSSNRVYAYIRDCTTPSDHLLVAGSTNFYAPYYTQRAIAGGHLYWHFGLRATPELEAQSLAILKRQSVPFLLSREPNAISEFGPYPNIRAYLLANFRPLEGTNGALWYDRRRPLVRTYGPDQWPCFR